MERSFEIKGINSISKSKIVFHKYVNSNRKIHISYGGPNGADYNKNGGGGNLRCSSNVLSRSAPLWILCLLYHFALLRLGCCGLSGCASRGALGVHEEL